MKEELIKLIEQNHLVERSIEYFWIHFDSFKQENTEEFNRHFPEYTKERLSIRVSAVSYDVNKSSNVEEITIFISFDYDNFNIGYFSAIYTLQGKFITSRIKL